MSKNEKGSKLKLKRFDKIEISESTDQINKVEKSDGLVKPRLNDEIQMSTEKSCNFMHPPCRTTNLANKRLQKLKQTIQSDLKNRKHLSTVTTKNSLLKQNFQECEASISKNSSKLINSNNSVRIESNQQRLSTISRINKSTSNIGSNRSSISSQQDVVGLNSSVQTLKKNYQSPRIEEKPNRKRKFSDIIPLSSDEYIPIKNFSAEPNNISQVKTTSNSHKSKLSSRVLKIKRKTDKINSSLTSPFKSNNQLEKHELNSSTPHSVHKLPDSNKPNQDTPFQLWENTKNNSSNSDFVNKNISNIHVSPMLKLCNQVESNETDNFMIQSKPHSLLQKRLNRYKLLNNESPPHSTDINRASTSSTVNKEPTDNNINSSNNCIVSKTLSQEMISAHNTPLLDGDDPFDHKMAMTASWIQNHQQYNPIYKITDGDHEKLATGTNIDNTKEEEMEWTNAEPDINEDSQLTEDQSNTIDSIKLNQKEQRLCIVVDTNVFISDMAKINDIIHLKVTGPLQPLVYIPWMVITELDEIKDRPNNSSLKNKVYNAIKCINKFLSEENPNVKGQTICDMGKQINVGPAQDDKIIGTCLQAAEKYESVMLLSNDVNLKNKALINNIAVSSAHEIIMKIMSKLVKNTKFQKIKQKMGMICSSIICECAKEAYGVVWMKMDMMTNPPWSLGECLKRFRKYWSSVYRDKLMKQFLSTIDKLQQLLDAHSTYITDDSDKYQEFVKLCLNLCIFLKDLEEYKGYMENTINDIVKIG
ncbi:transcriptional protein SWT1 [Diorhabda sublineata]|uniref:transcriptional protein SWT1 n=1 Tax=Diorhabda sublineata TaxID=1163346 RepID=UPI0024E0E556|nr:transcriptional protein SWT1 [Diorhabda sublineata]